MDTIQARLAGALRHYAEHVGRIPAVPRGRSFDARVRRLEKFPRRVLAEVLAEIGASADDARADAALARVRRGDDVVVIAAELVRGAVCAARFAAA
jgi:hypothetical protein